MPRKTKRRTRRKRGGKCATDGFSSPGMKSYINAEVNNISGHKKLPFGWMEYADETKCPNVKSGMRTGDLDLAKMREQLENYKQPFTVGNPDAVKNAKNAWACGCIIPGCAAEKFKKQKTKMYNELVEHLKTKKDDYPDCNWTTFENNNPLKGGKRRKSRKKRRKSKKRKSRRKRKRSRRRRRRR